MKYAIGLLLIAFFVASVGFFPDHVFFLLQSILGKNDSVEVAGTTIRFKGPVVIRMTEEERGSYWYDLVKIGDDSKSGLVVVFDLEVGEEFTFIEIPNERISLIESELSSASSEVAIFTKVSGKPALVSVDDVYTAFVPDLKISITVNNLDSLDRLALSDNRPQ